MVHIHIQPSIWLYSMFAAASGQSTSVALACSQLSVRAWGVTVLGNTSLLCAHDPPYVSYCHDKVTSSGLMLACR